ncbi:hypothetical protein DYB30_010217 [Aphanomyces astaci]|uniref:Uncharacterized protein n=1 Tax=Aphanomyces astaci TaxID=112090 RepID=A0A396ZXM7_APHAT|nr:hypothetical protein DYB36_008105 [Aphanomyces astaci]RHY75926.1 hypothetical protein DYB30_010217 [Aphanomyces astaci]
MCPAPAAILVTSSSSSAVPPTPPPTLTYAHPPRHKTLASLNPTVTKDESADHHCITKNRALVARCKHPVTVPCMKHTLAWLHSHDLSHHTIPSSFLQSLLHWFHDRPGNTTPPLSLGWGSGNLTFSWSDRSFGVLNAPLYADIAVARRILTTASEEGGFISATRSQRSEFSSWFAEFLDAVRSCDELKHQLLVEKARLSSKVTQVTTSYDRVRLIYEGAQKHDVAAYGASLLQCLDEVDAVLRDEERAVDAVNLTASTETLENAAFSLLFGRLNKRTNDSHVYVAKLMAWMRQTLSRDDFDAFFQLLQPRVKESLAKNWKTYARHMQRLEPFQGSADDGTSGGKGFTRSRAVSSDQSHNQQHQHP